MGHRLIAGASLAVVPVVVMRMKCNRCPTKINLSRRRLLGTAIMTVAGAQLGAMASAKTWFGGGRELSSLAHATMWLNSPPLTAAELRGRVVLVDFWTYTVSTGAANFPMFARGPRNTKIKVWS